MVKHDAHGRASVRSETWTWIEARTGIALKRQIVTRWADGKQRADTTWEVDSLDDVPS